MRKLLMLLALVMMDTIRVGLVAAASFQTGPTTTTHSRSTISSAVLSLLSSSASSGPAIITRSTSVRQCRRRPDCLGYHHHRSSPSPLWSHGSSSRRQPLLSPFSSSSSYSSYSSSASQLRRGRGTSGLLLSGGLPVDKSRVFGLLTTRLKSSSSSSSSSSSDNKKANANSSSLTIPLSSPENRLQEYQDEQAALRHMQTKTLLRVFIPSLVAGAVATYAFPGVALFLASSMNDGVFTVLSQDSSQFVQNFLNVSSLLFSILVGQTYNFVYQQTENVYYALFNEVTEAKSLLEQVALVCQGRSMYAKCLSSIQRYVQDDLKQLHADPAVLLSARPSEDPLESIMYMTSVGVPSTVYETVKSLRQARAQRLGALQRKLPVAHMWLLYILAAIELVSFPLLGAGTQRIGGYKVLTVEGILFGVVTMGIVLVLRVVKELWRPAGGAYNVDAVLSTMVRGLEDELHARMAGRNVYGGAAQMAPSARMDDLANVFAPGPRSNDTSGMMSTDAGGIGAKQQGGNIFQAMGTIYQWIRARRIFQRS